MTLSVSIWVTDTFYIDETKCKVKATSSDGATFDSVPGSARLNPLPAGTTLPAGGKILTASLISDNSIKNTVGMQTFRLSWQTSANDGTKWDKAGQTENLLYRILDALPPNPTLFQTALDVGCRGGNGATTPDAFTNKMWEEFATKSVKRADGQPMHYWGAIAGYVGGAPEDAYFSVPDLIANTDGRCGAWSYFMVYIAAINGVSMQQSGITTTGAGGYSAIYVNPDAPAQNNSHPWYFFADHAVVIWTGNPPANPIYDPSYGTFYSGSTSKLDWEKAAIIAYRYGTSFVYRLSSDTNRYCAFSPSPGGP